MLQRTVKTLLNFVEILSVSDMANYECINKGTELTMGWDGASSFGRLPTKADCAIYPQAIAKTE